jgi:hypothetical protein
MRVITFALIFLLVQYVTPVKGQLFSCPPNIDFESGNFTNWVLYAGSCCPINTTLSGALVNRHTITNGVATDPYGGFPVVNPANGLYSLKLGNNAVGRQAERARYYVKVPTGVNNYSLIFRYAVVFEDPNHNAGDQPRFEVRGYDSATNVPIPCAQFTYVAGAIPGFNTVVVGGNTVRYKSWSTASINLSGYGGKTVAIDFASGDCALGAHFGYGYVDVNCALFSISSAACSNAPTTTLTAPPGFDTYEWRDSATWNLVASGQTVTIATPPVTTKYAVILKPFSGFGCPDTLFTTLKIFSLTSNLGADTLICKADTAKISALVAGSSPPFTYTWSPASNLTCTNCPNPKAVPLSTQQYVLTIADANGCLKYDTVVVNVNQGPQVSLTGNDVTCFGLNNGSINALASSGIPPYTYSWNTAPVKTTALVNSLNPGTYTVLVKDSLGCKISASDTITQPTALKDTVVNTHVLCFGNSTGAATVSASGGIPPYTYTWSTSPVQTGPSISAVAAGNYLVTIKDANNCTIVDTAKVTEPAALTAVFSTHTNVSCFGGNNGASGVTVSGGTPPYIYNWNTTPAKTTALASGLSAGVYTVIITDANGCNKILVDTITQPPLLTAVANKTDVSCNGATTGTAGVVASGGTMPYSYSWNTSPMQTTANINALAAGTYIATVTDARSCIAIAQATVGQPTQLSNTKTKSDVVCNGGATGSATVLAAGGIVPYTYTWNTIPVKTGATVTGLSAGSYIVTITDGNNCTKKDTVVVNQPAVLNTSVMGTHVSCNGGNSGTAAVVATGGVAPYTYSWNTVPVQLSPGISGLTAGKYIVTVVDNNGCVKADSVTVAQPPALVVAISKTNVSCNAGINGTATATVTGGAPSYKYLWNTTPVQTTANASSLSAGTYTLTVTDALNCQASATTTITQPTALAGTTSKTDVTCFGLTNGVAGITMSGGTSPYAYSWNTNPVKTTAAINNITAGTYTATVTDANNCIYTASVTVAQPATLESNTSQANVSCFGGSNGAATVSVVGGNMPYSYSWNTSPSQNTATASGLTVGQYIVAIADNRGCVASDTVIITEPPMLAATTAVTDVPCYNNANGTANVITTGGTQPYTYWWNTTPVQTSAGAQFLPAGKYTVQVTDALYSYRSH